MERSVLSIAASGAGHMVMFFVLSLIVAFILPPQQSSTPLFVRLPKEPRPEPVRPKAIQNRQINPAMHVEDPVVYRAPEDETLWTDEDSVSGWGKQIPKRGDGLVAPNYRLECAGSRVSYPPDPGQTSTPWGTQAVQVEAVPVVRYGTQSDPFNCYFGSRGEPCELLLAVTNVVWGKFQPDTLVCAVFYDHRSDAWWKARTAIRSAGRNPIVIFLVWDSEKQLYRLSFGGDEPDPR